VTIHTTVMTLGTVQKVQTKTSLHYHVLSSQKL